MCEKRIVRLSRGCKKNRLREARRIQRLRLQSQSPPVDSRPSPQPRTIVLDEDTQKRMLIEIALRTVSLVQRNNLIQQKIIDLKQETRDYINNVSDSPENEEIFSEHIRIYWSLLKQTQQLQAQHKPLIDYIRFPGRLTQKPC